MQGAGRRGGVRSRLLSPLHAPRGASIPSALSRLRILPVITGVYVPHQHPYSRLRRLSVSVSLWQIPRSQKLTPSLSSLCPLFRAPFLCFQELAASFCKTPGVGGGRCDLSRPLVTSPLSTFRTATTPVRLAVHSSSGQLAASPDLHTAMDKRIASADAAIAKLTNGATILVGGFGLGGGPERLIDARRRKGTTSLT